MESGLKRNEVIIDERKAGNIIEDGMAISIGGFITSSHPMAIIRELIKKKVRNLTVIGSASAGLEVDLLIGAGCVKKVVTPYVGAEALCPIGPFYRAYAQKGDIDIWECDEGQFYAGLRAAAQQLPFMPIRSGLGTSYPEVNPDLKVFKDPINGEPLVAVPAIKIDVAIIHAAISDPYGNVQFVGGGHGDRAHYRAAKRTIVEVEKIVPNEDIRKNPAKTALYSVDAVVRAPYGSHPYASPGYYREDVKHIREYVKAATAVTRDGDQEAWNEYLRKYIFEPENHLDYLEKVGAKRLFSLYEH